ncbi:hypothetical protein BYT27DRAFT_7092960 [Phlegmacium glaucopus]|nr:hypothetical protein BYT27DRAFT_7092960 [Phlegmacium glaucopus]
MDFLFSDVPDPTDFPTSAPGLRSLDGSLRCTICGDLFDAPVTLPCGHCFCSACIRPPLAIKPECPNCRKAANEGHLRPNPVMEETVSAWNTARPFVLQLVNRPAITAHGVGLETPKKRKRSPEWTPSVEPMFRNVAGPSNSRKPSSPTKSSKSPVKKVKASSDSEDAIEIAVPSSDVDEDEITPNPMRLNPQADDLVRCPICKAKVRYKRLNAHIDNDCKDPSSAGDTSKTWSKIMARPNITTQQKGKNNDNDDNDDDYPLPKASYGTLKDKQLKDMLREYGLPVTGDRSLWEQRHQQWVVLYNANLDRSPNNRKTTSELKKDLKKWEEERPKKKKAVVSDVLGYQITHKAEFSRLVGVAKQTNDKIAAQISIDGDSVPDAMNPQITVASPGAMHPP